MTKTRSGCRASPVIKDGDKNEGRSAYILHFGNDERALAIKRRTELQLHVNLPS